MPIPAATVTHRRSLPSQSSSSSIFFVIWGVDNDFIFGSFHSLHHRNRRHSSVKTPALTPLLAISSFSTPFILRRQHSDFDAAALAVNTPCRHSSCTLLLGQRHRLPHLVTISDD